MAGLGTLMGRTLRFIGGFKKMARGAIGEVFLISDSQIELSAYAPDERIH